MPAKLGEQGPSNAYRGASERSMGAEVRGHVYQELVSETEERGGGGRIRHTLRLPWKGSGLVCPPALLPPALMGESGKKEEEKEEEGCCKAGFDDAAPEVSESFLKRYAILLHCKGSGQGGRHGKSTKASGGGGALFLKKKRKATTICTKWCLPVL